MNKIIDTKILTQNHTMEQWNKKVKKPMKKNYFKILKWTGQIKTGIVYAIKTDGVLINFIN